MANVKFVCEVVDEPIDFSDLEFMEVFVDGESEKSHLYLQMGSYARNLITGINRAFDDDHIVCRVKIPLVNPQQE